MMFYFGPTPEVPFLPVRDDFHPKRNQARQKLATLPKTRFKDLSGDVFHELGRRYPEFKEPEVRMILLVIHGFVFLFAGRGREPMAFHHRHLQCGGSTLS